MDSTHTDTPMNKENLTAHQRETRKLVRSMMVLTRQSASGLATAAGLTPSTVNRFMHKTVRHTLSQRTMLALLTETFLHLRDTPREEWDNRALEDLIPALAVYENGILELAPDVEPILKNLRAASNTQFGVTSFSSEPQQIPNLPVILVSTRDIDVTAGNFDAAPMRTQRPPFLRNDPRAFAILMPNDALIPRYDAGDMIYVSPAVSLDGPKVDVVLEHPVGGFVFGELIVATDQSITIETLHPPGRESYNRDKLRGTYRIVGLQRL